MRFIFSLCAVLILTAVSQAQQPFKVIRVQPAPADPTQPPDFNPEAPKYERWDTTRGAWLPTGLPQTSLEPIYHEGKHIASRIILVDLTKEGVKYRNAGKPGGWQYWKDGPTQSPDQDMFDTPFVARFTGTIKMSDIATPPLLATDVYGPNYTEARWRPRGRFIQRQRGPSINIRNLRRQNGCPPGR